MRKIAKKWIGLVLTICMTVLLFSVPAFAAEDNTEVTEELKVSVADFLESVLPLSDDELALMGEYGDFYTLMADTIAENRKELGEFKELKTDTMKAELDKQWACTVKASYENYDAEIVVYLDETGSTPMNFVINIDYPLGKKMIQAAQNTVIGIAIVFVMLLFLAFVISLFKYISPEERKAKKLSRQQANMPTHDNVEVTRAKAAPAPVVQAAASNDDEIIAVIAAAIAAAQADSTNTGDSYVVRSIKKVGTSRRWKRA